MVAACLVLQTGRMGNVGSGHAREHKLL
jgi:hypothetical protein